MPKTHRISGCTDWIDLSFVERERTPRQLMELGIRLHLAGLSLSNAVLELEKFGGERSRKAVHAWVHKCDLQPADDEKRNHVALDETVIQLDEHPYWLYTAVDPKTSKILHIRLHLTTITTLTERFLQELTGNITSTMTCFSSMEQNISRLHSIDLGSDFDTKNMEIGTLRNVTFVR